MDMTKPDHRDTENFLRQHRMHVGNHGVDLTVYYERMHALMALSNRDEVTAVRHTQAANRRSYTLG